MKYPAELPIADRKDEIVAAIRDHQVVIVAGETGSGKSTQLPKMCLEAGRGVDGRMIGHTQPRRLAARTVAERIASELGTEVGDVVGYTFRFTDRVRKGTQVKVMTDGILLAELQRDRMLSRYDTIIVDEAHERSLNIDFILGYLKQLLPKRADLKVIVTSATIDTSRFSAHFDDAPIIEVSGRTYPVSIVYEVIDEETDQEQAICDAVETLMEEGPGDILVFLSGEREIRDTADALTGRRLKSTEIVPLFARLSSVDQHKVFQPHQGRRVVLATNVAETSLTVPGIHYVVDPGTARISRYNRRTKVQRLPIEKISQASANQRAGRCGRIAPGIAVRLYAEDDFANRPEFTEPEILRTNLASVILQMTAIGLGDIEAFPFVEPPDARSIKDGVALLEELGALLEGRLTETGRRLAQLPVDPRLGRMVLEAERHGCVDEVMVIAAALSIQDPRERPTGKEQAAAEMHRRFADDSSDFIGILNLWRYLQEQQAAMGSSAFRRMCKTEHLHHLRIREWQDVHGQLRQVAKSMRIHVGHEEGTRDGIHQALLAGLLSHIGVKDAETNEFTGARGARFTIGRGSVLANKPPRWVMAAELVETNRLWARVAARMQPEWAEKLGAHLVTRDYGEPWWDASRGSAMANERVTLYGLPVVSARRVQYGRINPEHARDIFIRCALVERDWSTHHPFFARNAELIEEVRALEDQVRRRDILVDEDTLFDLYDGRIPTDVVTARDLDRWIKRSGADLTFSRDDLIERDVDPDGFPEVWQQGDLALPISYVFDPESDLDGVVVDIPLSVLNRVRDEGFDWQIPGLRLDMVTALLRALPKDLRRDFVPATEHAARFLAHNGPADGRLVDVLERELGITGWPVEQLADHLVITFRVVDERGDGIAFSKDLDALKEHLREQLLEVVQQASRSIEQRGLRSWGIGALPRVITSQGVTVYPALVDEGETVGVRTFTTEVEQRNAMWAGTRRLLRLNVSSPSKQIERVLRTDARLALAVAPTGTIPDVVTASFDKALLDAGGPVWDPAAFAALQQTVRDALPRVAEDITREVARILVTLQDVESRLTRITAPAALHALTDISAQLGRLVFPGFVTAAGAVRLADVHRYLRAITLRLDSLANNPRRDQELTTRLGDLESLNPPADVRWMIEELRVSWFAQSLGTKGKVSPERILRAIDAAR